MCGRGCECAVFASADGRGERVRAGEQPTRGAERRRGPAAQRRVQRVRDALLLHHRAMRRPAAGEGVGCENPRSAENLQFKWLEKIKYFF